MPAGGKATEQSIRDATRNSLQAADDLYCESLVMPAIGCGVAGFDFEEGVHVICEEIATFDPEYLENVRLIAYADDEFEEMEQIVEDYQ